jgi:L-threonylcarbamoyladenylate synthase
VSGVDDAVRVLRSGGLVAFPTETVYGLGADAANADALARLYAVKRRPIDHPVIVHIGADTELDHYASEIRDAARALAAEFWPGPLTLVVRKRPDRIADAATGGRNTVGLRVPSHPLALALLAEFGGGLAAPSANRFGRVSPTTAAHVHADLGADVDLILDGGPCTVGVESTIVDVTGSEPAILRVGGITERDVTRVTGRAARMRDDGTVAAPGTLPAHYAPDAFVEVVTPDAVVTRARQLLQRGTRVGLLALESPKDVPVGLVVLDAPADVDDYGRVLYARLRQADQAGLGVVLVVPPPPHGVGLAVIDRLRRASVRRDTDTS